MDADTYIYVLWQHALNIRTRLFLAQFGSIYDSFRVVNLFYLTFLMQSTICTLYQQKHIGINAIQLHTLTSAFRRAITNF